MALFIFIMLTVIVLVGGLLLALSLGALAGVVGIAAFAILATAAIIGFITRRPAEAVRALLAQCAAFVGFWAGLAGTWLYEFAGPGRFDSWMNLVYGALAGALLGMIAGMQLSKLLQYVVARYRGQHH